MLKKLIDIEELENVEMRFIKYAPFMARTEGRQTHRGTFFRIFINHATYKIIRTRRGMRLIYAELAHEIGHVMHHKKNLVYLEKEQSPEEKLVAEKGADEYALLMLSKIFPDPKEVLLEQSFHALKASLLNKNASVEEKNLAREIFRVRSGFILG
ncbi:MAG TPA: hypothetical protein PKA31_03345 [Candidatus Moranbacteria bacterium]|nr:hypothetical protein [Candidatus Moranbacteria bacterium]